MQFSGYASADVDRLAIAARSLLLQADADLFVEKREMCPRDDSGRPQPFDRRALSTDDRTWIEPRERRVATLNAALAAFGVALPNPASAS